MIMNLMMKMTKLFQLVRMEDVVRVLDVVKKVNVAVNMDGVVVLNNTVELMKDSILLMVTVLNSPLQLLLLRQPLNHIVVHHLNPMLITLNGDVVKVLDPAQVVTVVVNMVGVEKPMNTVNLKKVVNPNLVSVKRNKVN